MTEQKPIYVTDTAAEYWQKVAKQERQKAEDNLRLAAERASTIQELSEELRAAKAEIERLKEIIRKVIAYCASGRVVRLGEIEAFTPEINVEDVKKWQKAIEGGAQ